jgi:hypothetical protein
MSTPTLYRVASKQPPHFSDPLHWAHFFPDKQRHHHGAMAKRQDLILYLANLHATASSSGMPLGMIEIPMRLMSLRDWVQDYRIVLDHFFEIRQLGYNFGDGNHDISILVPKALANFGDKAASKAAVGLKYVVPPRPDVGIVSKVYIQQQNKEKILKRLADTSRLDLYSPVEFLLSIQEHNFYFAPSGKLQMRDTSTWPVQAVETWPSWLREDLFGAGVDIDSAYTQYIVDNLRLALASQPKLLALIYPDLIRSLEDKKAWRAELCTDVLGLELNETNLGTVKKLCMSLANGSRISPAILTGGRAFSVTADLVISTTDDVSLVNLTRIGKRLARISNQYSAARKTVCTWLLKTNPSRVNQKKVFSSYFEWERVARYAIWESCGQHGIMVHDGIDGIPEEYLKDIPRLMSELNIKITRS